ncbi:DeoR/GlpR family DNA-binding transcription regulator [Candidatus Enterococcus murrayae]|uniref:DeoR/GlpR transcriptional regulator n=1 Tax=Candidatus Enterococcus murrayae TaxID=2815321 RepID=A0ABS3HCA6_9ENTE|nr:DeoR/GlpR family DNA-binding transcription regulator [Enterococcus sp. MJM16]MBO0450833.1 DeoR/GlpR transcriptional regulator [Enterococcus sp. MJM16]
MKNSIINIDKRHKDILDILEKNEHMTTLELAEALDVSLSTIRRDLHLLEEKNDIIRKFGYCIFNFDNKLDNDHSGPVRIKQAIAQEANKYIHDDDTIFINSSSTALKTVDFMHAEHLTIITNNLKINYSLQNANYNYVLTGGEMRYPKESLVGDVAINTISAVNADVCIIGCNGVDLENGVTTKFINEAAINEMMVKKTTRCKILVADHRKIGITSKFKIADVSSFDYLITDKFSSDTVLEEFQNMGVTVVQVT